MNPLNSLEVFVLFPKSKLLEKNSLENLLTDYASKVTNRLNL